MGCFTVFQTNICLWNNLPAPLIDVGWSRKYLYFFRLAGWCHNASGRCCKQTWWRKPKSCYWYLLPALKLDLDQSVHTLKSLGVLVNFRGPSAFWGHMVELRVARSSLGITSLWIPSSCRLLLSFIVESSLKECSPFTEHRCMEGWMGGWGLIG